MCSSFGERSIICFFTRTISQALPFSDSLRVLSYLKEWIAHPEKVSGATITGATTNLWWLLFLYYYHTNRIIIWSCFCCQVELVCRVSTVLLQIHHYQLTSTISARPILSLLNDILHARVKVVFDKACSSKVLLSHTTLVWFLESEQTWCLCFVRNAKIH